MGLSSILFYAMMLAAAPADTPCNPIPGAQSLIERPGLRWIVVGEMHGTNESPAAFLDLVCAASAGRPVVVAVEQSVGEQQAIDAFIASDGSPQARAAFLKSSIWTGRMKDGRSSEAQFRLFDTLRTMKADGRVSRVVAFQPASYSEQPGENEKRMAQELSSRAGQADLVLALVGNLHARLTPISFGQPPYSPMAAHLPAEATITLDVRANGGSTWACMANGCAVQSLRSPPTGPARSLVLGDSTAADYSGALYLGVPATASPPQQAE